MNVWRGLKSVIVNQIQKMASKWLGNNSLSPQCVLGGRQTGDNIDILRKAVIKRGAISVVVGRFWISKNGSRSR